MKTRVARALAGSVLVAALVLIAPSAAVAIESASGGARSCTLPRTIQTSSTSPAGSVWHYQVSGGVGYERTWTSSSTQTRYYNIGKYVISQWAVSSSTTLTSANATCVL